MPARSPVAGRGARGQGDPGVPAHRGVASFADLEALAAPQLSMFAHRVFKSVTG
jgi:hypothetical protein